MHRHARICRIVLFQGEKMKTKLKYIHMPVAAAGLFVLTACATNRPPRQISSPGLRPMPPSYEEVYHGGSRPQSVQPGAIELVPMVPVVVEPLPPLAVEAPKPAPVAPRTGTPYTVRRGDSLSGIASRHRITWRELADYNHIADPNRIRVGQTLLIPDGAAASPDVRQSAPAAAPSAPAPVASAAVAGSGTYVVQPGDSLSVVARRNNTSVRALREVNNLSSDTIRVGQTLKLPAGSASGSVADSGRSVPAPTPAAPPAPSAPGPAALAPLAPVPAPAPAVEAPADERAFTIVVEEGDTLESISTSYVVSVEALRRENNLGPNAQVKTGDRLRIPPTSW